jgi:hypothetical protein
LKWWKMADTVQRALQATSPEQPLTASYKQLAYTVPTEDNMAKAKTVSAAPKKKGGRPRTKDIAKNKTGNKKVGRPPGDKAIMDEYKARMLTSPKSRLILDKVMDAALDDDHKHQAVAWKLVTERIIPVGQFQEVKDGQGGINITITTAGDVSVGASAAPDDIPPLKDVN